MKGCFVNRCQRPAVGFPECRWATNPMCACGVCLLWLLKIGHSCRPCPAVPIGLLDTSGVKSIWISCQPHMVTFIYIILRLFMYASCDAVWKLKTLLDYFRCECTQNTLKPLSGLLWAIKSIVVIRGCIQVPWNFSGW